MNPRVHLFFGARYRCELYDLRTLWQVASHNPWLSVSPVSEYTPRSAVGRRLSRRVTAARPARAPNRPAARRGDQVRRLGRPADPDLRRPGHGPRDQGRSDRQRRAAGTHSARSARQAERAGSRLPSAVVTLTRPVVIGGRTVRARGRHDRHLADRRRRGTARPAPRPGRLRHRRQDDGHPDSVSLGKSVGRQQLYGRGRRRDADAGRTTAFAPTRNGLPIHGVLAAYRAGG